MNDIAKIRKELISHVKVELPYIFNKGTHIKYLTLKDEAELFYRGGEFICQKGNCILLNNCGKHWKVPINYYDNDGDIIYTTTFFIENKINEKDCSKENKRKDEIILTQQEIIKKLTTRIKELEYHLMLNDS